MTEYDILFNDSITNRENIPLLIDWLIDDNREIEADCWKFVYYFDKKPVKTDGWIWSCEKNGNLTGPYLPDYLFYELMGFFDNKHLTIKDAYIRLINAWHSLTKEKRQKIMKEIK